jgi:hypothetical protein
MKLIAHRGLYDGPDRDKENAPGQLLKAVELGYDCEVDVWHTEEGFFLGHDAPTYPTTIEFISNPKFWIHAKNLGALYELTLTDLNYFWHQEDDFTLTSKGYIWTYPSQPLTKNSVMVLPEWEDYTLDNVKGQECYAVCSDFVSHI